MGKKGRIPVKKRVVRKKPTASSPAVSPHEPRESSPMEMGDGEARLIHHLTDTLPWIHFAAVLQFLGAALFLGIGICLVLAWPRIGDGDGAMGGDELTGGAALAGSGLSVLLLLTLATRVVRVHKTILRFRSEQGEPALETMMVSLEAVWRLVGGTFFVAVLTVALLTLFLR